MSEEQKHFDGISDPSNYRKLCEPMTQAEAEKSVNAFFREFYDLRNKHGITEAYVIVKVQVKTEAGEGEIMSAMHCGDELSRESMTAWAFGREQALRQERIARLLAESQAVRTPRSRK